MATKQRFQITANQYERLHEIGVLKHDSPTELWNGIVHTFKATQEPEKTWFARFKAIAEELLGDSFTVLFQPSLCLNENTLTKPAIVVTCHGDLNAEQTFVFPDQVHLVITTDATSDPPDHQEFVNLYSTAGIPELWLVSAKSRVTTQHAAPGNRQFTYFKNMMREEEIVSIALPQLKFFLSDLLGPFPEN